jgi:hypothetical protein
MKYKLCYAPLNLDGDILCHEFNTKDDLIAFVDKIVYPKGDDRVYLVCVEDEVFVTEKGWIVSELFEEPLRTAWPYYEGDVSHIHEYTSYEEAYKVALAMKETSPLCYEKDETA